ncbi:MAG: HlyD family efflux transporter periplasmic adaptor subunit [Streptococcaceae bacterium]|jgi:multidrug resistance efflux pump|nr:HlyD family efflux transporter periplasmic adaptor subunit [Streptococcaceae bacterium]
MAIFRQKSLDKLSSPEQLDKLVVVASPMTWLILIGAGLIVVATVIWSMISTVPKTQTAQGFYMNVGDLQSIYSMSQGIVERALVKSGDKVKRGKVLFEIKGGEDIVATTSGTVTSIAVANGTPIAKGSIVARIKQMQNQAYVTSYVGIQVAKTIKKGMPVNVYVSAFPKEEYGHMEAKVDYVGGAVSSSADMFSALHDESLVKLFSAQGPVVEVRCDLKKDNTSVSGYEWSTKQGKNVKPEGGTPVTADIVTSEKHPISMLIPTIKEKIGFE